MINLTHDESSAVDINGEWVEADKFQLVMRFNKDDEEDLIVNLLLTTEEVEIFADYIQQKLNRPRMH